MSFKRATWTSGYTYRRDCEYCRTPITYTDRQLDFRPWYTNGFIYCPRCRKPLRHSEIYAVRPDGTQVYANQAEADAAIRIGYYDALGISPPPENVASAAPAGAQTPAVDPNFAFCPDCGARYERGKASFCRRCGRNHQR